MVVIKKEPARFTLIVTYHDGNVIEYPRVNRFAAEKDAKKYERFAAVKETRIEPFANDNDN